MPKKFGEEIDSAKANAHYEKFVLIKSKSSNIIQEALYPDDEAIRYYCGNKDIGTMDSDLAFIFDKNSIKRILSMLADDSGGTSEADGIAIFNGARMKDANDDDGRPTIMIFPYVHSTRGDTDSKLNIFLEKGSEHPGTATKHEPKRNRYIVPGTFEPVDVIQYLDSLK